MRRTAVRKGKPDCMHHNVISNHDVGMVIVIKTEMPPKGMAPLAVIRSVTPSWFDPAIRRFEGTVLIL